MILNVKQFKHKLQEDGVKCIFFFEGHGAIDHDAHRPFKRIGGGQDEKLSVEECLKQFEGFAELYPDAYSCYTYTTSASIIQKGWFSKVDLRIKGDTEAENTQATYAVDEVKLEARIRKEIESEKNIETLVEELKIQTDINVKNEVVSSKLASVALNMLKQYSAGMEGAPMQGAPQSAPPKSKLMNIDEAVKYLKAELGEGFMIILAGKIKDSNDAGENPNLATKLKAML